MNKRQKKKRRNKFIALNNYPQEPFSEWQCPYCGWDHLDNDPEYEKCTTSNHWRSWEGCANWDVDVKCPVCGTEFSYSDGT